MAALIRRVVALADIDSASIMLPELQLSQWDVSKEAMQHDVARHYSAALIRESYKLLGSASIFGDPIAVIQHTR